MVVVRVRDVMTLAPEEYRVAGIHALKRLEMITMESVEIKCHRW